MLLSSIPYKFAQLWAQLAGSTYLTSPIPVSTPSNVAASQQLGFPPETATAIAAGGTPPNIDDFNGAFQYLSAWANWQQLGAPIPYDPVLQTAFGGYPLGSVVRSVVNPLQSWMSTVDANTTDPDTGGSGWVKWPVKGEIFITAVGTNIWTAPAGVWQVYAECLGGGGGASGSDGASGCGGGYSGGLVNVTPGNTYAAVVGLGGAQCTDFPNPPDAQDGGNSSFTGDDITVTGTGGSAGLAGVGPPGFGTGGTTNVSGGNGTDLTDSPGNTDYTAGLVGNAVGGAGAGPFGGSGGVSNSSTPILLGPGYGGGGGANSAFAAAATYGGNGAVRLRWGF